jgi:ATP-dependent Clp protease ATP-binding subunit ClpC
VLRNVGLKLEDVRQEILNLVGAGPMPIGLTDRVRRVIAMASQEAQRSNREYVGTENLLLGLAEEGNGVAAVALRNLGVDIQKVRPEVEKLIKSGPDTVTPGTLPPTSPAREAVRRAMEEARSQNHACADTGHLLLALLQESEGTAVQALLSLGLTADGIRQEVLKLHTEGIRDEPPEIYAGRHDWNK